MLFYHDCFALRRPIISSLFLSLYVDSSSTRQFSFVWVSHPPPSRSVNDLAGDCKETTDFNFVVVFCSILQLLAVSITKSTPNSNFKILYIFYLSSRTVYLSSRTTRAYMLLGREERRAILGPIDRIVLPAFLRRL
jgi:hypothetical protein